MSAQVEINSLLETSSPPNPLALRLRQKLSSCSESIEAGDLSSVSELLDSVSEAADAEDDAFQVLSEILNFLSSPALSQTVIDVLSFELPKAVSRFAGVSDECLRIVDEIIYCFVTKCSPRDMLSIFCEALGFSSQMTSPSCYAAPLFSGLAKVIPSIKRRQFEQVKVAVPIILNVLKFLSLEMDHGDIGCINLFTRALGIADSIQATCAKLEGRVDDNLCALLGLYVLQVMGLLSLCMGSKISLCLPLVYRLSAFLPLCGCSFIGLITESDIGVISKVITEEEEDYLTSCFSYIRLGASLSVIWGYISEEVAQAATENMSVIKDELQSNQIKRWQVVGMLKHTLSSVNLPWELREHSIDFLLFITDGKILEESSDKYTECFVYVPGLCAALLGITKVIIYAPNKTLRKNAFEALKRVLADTPTSLRVDIFQNLITNSNSSSMIAILLDVLRGELHMESCQKLAIRKDEASQADGQERSMTSLWTGGVLQLVELVLRPPTGLPAFPELGDAVLAALNLYRFILMTESARKTNYTGVLSKNNLRKAHSEWLLPLRTLVAGIVAENKNDYDQSAVDTVCALNPVELVLYHCLELVEEKLKQSM